MAENIAENMFVPNVHFELIPIKMLVSNQTYQRPLSNAHVGRTASDFNIYQINPVKVSRRDGTNFVFDGQHTIETVAIASESRDTPIWCMIYDDLNYEQEADIFANQKKYTRPLKSIEIFNAHIEAENDVQMTIKSVVESYRLVISSHRVPGNVTAVSALEYIFSKYGYQVLDRALFLIVSTWEGDIDSLSSSMLKGVAKLVVAYGDKLNDEQFVERLSKVSIREVIRVAKDRHAGTQGYAEALLLQYNKRLKYPLRWNPLHGSAEQSAENQEQFISEDAQIELEDGFMVHPITGEIIEEPTDDYEDEGEDMDEVPNHSDALPSQLFMNHLDSSRETTEINLE